MSHVNVWVHAVWGSKDRRPYLTKEIRGKVIEHILLNAKKKEIHIDSLNGYTDHLHCLFGLNADMSLAKALQLLKGESAFWINKEKITPQKFEWAEEYYASSVSQSALAKVRAYIKDQEDHHKKTTFMMEYEEFMRSVSGAGLN